MRRIGLTLLALLALLLAIPAFSQDKAAQIANLESQLGAVQANYPTMQDRLKVLDTTKDNILFAAKAYTKYNDAYTADTVAFNNQQDEVNRQQNMLNVSGENYKQRLAQHNANRCTEVTGSGTSTGTTPKQTSLTPTKHRFNRRKPRLTERTRNWMRSGRTLHKPRRSWTRSGTKVRRTPTSTKRR